EDRKESGKGGFQLEFSGSGNLDEEGRRRIDFLFRGPDIQEKSIFGERDEYRFSFYNRPLGFHLGDRPYSLSPLTESFRYGRGAEVDFHPGKLGMGAFFLNTKWTEPKEREIGAYLRYQFSERFGIKGNFLNKSISEKDFTDNLLSIEGKLSWGKKLDLDLECGFGESSRQKEVNDYAYRVDLKGEFSNDLWYSFQKTYAGSGFFGYYRGVDYTIGTINFPIYGNLRGNLNLRHLKEDFDLELDEARTTANKELSLRGGLSYFFPFGTNISFDYEDFQREDRLRPRDYDFREKVFRLGLGQTFRKFSLQTYIERGKLEDKLSLTKGGDLASYSIYGTFQPSNWQSYSLYTRFGHSLYTESLERTTTVGISGNWRIKDRLNINVNYQKNLIDPDRKQEQDNILALLTYTLPNHHFIDLKSLWTRTKDGNGKETSFYLSYTIPLKIPVGKKKSIGIIKGKVYDGERSEKPPIPNVILTANGATAVTNRNGQFIFPALRPGNYYLQVEKGSIGLGRTTMERLPIITVKGGETNEIEIAVVTSCKVSGRVILFAPKSEIIQKERFEPEDLKKVNGLANVLIEISKGNEVIRQLTDEKGGFSFEDLRPGRWSLKAYEDNLPPYHYFEKREFLVDLRPGQEEEITINVFPRLRRIQIIEEGEIKEESGN
ncbi:MAG: carboxypeptidase-like regulatory domain-containing protein, partial [Nitrospirota bacterium]|nr:carboxypeptidase-like regulatory domain-containing protein [Nitrospirota bacterium]